MINKHYKDVNKALRKRDLIDTFFVGKYSFSPYMACMHACKYCDGRAEKYYVEGDFEKDIIIRRNLPTLLEAEMKKLREKGPILIGSGISDPYQPIEKDEKIMARASAIIAKHKGFPAIVHTKSSLVLRDIDNWKKISDLSGFSLSMSLTFLDDNLRKVFEPGASSVDERLETLKAFKDEGMKVGVLAMPFMPYISDSRENITSLFKKLKEINVDFIIPSSMSLRPGRQKESFLKILEKNYPELVEKYIHLYSENRQSGYPMSSYSSTFYRMVQDIQNDFQIPMIVPHHIYKGIVPLYDEVLILLDHMCSEYSRKNIDISRLKKALGNYKSWLKKEKAIFNRKRSLSYSDLEDKLAHMFETNEFSELIENEKLTNHLKQIISYEKQNNLLIM